MELTDEMYLQVVRAIIKRCAELTCEAIDKDLSIIRSLSIVDQIYKRAYWQKFGHLMANLPTKQATDEEEKWRLIFAMFGDRLDLPSNSIKVDVKGRLDWLKRR